MISGGAEIPVAGVSFEGRQAVLEDLYRVQASGSPLSGELVREPENVHDRNAIKVHINGRQVGYVPRLTAPELAPLMDGGGTVMVTGVRVIQGSDTRIAFGARVDVEIQIKEVS